MSSYITDLINEKQILMKENQDIKDTIRKLLQYSNPSGTILHSYECQEYELSCCCGLDDVINKLRQFIIEENSYDGYHRF